MSREDNGNSVCPGREPHIKIRRMTLEDIPEVAALEAQCFSQPWSEKGFADALKQPDNIFLVAETRDGMIAAYCGLYAAADEGEITNVAVSESMRHMGIGFAVVGEILNRAKRRGIQKVFLEVRQSNGNARKLYEKAGFTDCGVRRNFYQLPREDAVVMCADISDVK